MNEALVQELCGRGIDKPFAVKLVGENAADRVEAAVAFFDGLSGDRGPGLLVTAIRQGKRPAERRQEDQGWRDMADFIRTNFPDLCDELGRPHPAAGRVLWRRGLRNVSVREHGGEIRRAVRDWEKRWES